MKKIVTILLCMVLSISVLAQQKIQMPSADRAECVKSDMTSLKASFSFSTIEAENVNTKGGEFSRLSMPYTVIGGNEGDPQIPVINELIAVPFGAHPVITVTSYSSRDYNLSDLGIKTLIPRQPSLRKDQRPEDVPFVMNKAAYEQTRGLHSEPVASVFVDGVMRGVQVGKMTIEPVSYDPVNNIIRVFNDIEVEVSFEGSDGKATEDMLLKTYSPYFDIVYAQLFNGRAVLDVYTQHPDLYSTPVKMIVITTSTYANNTTFQNWVKWKKQKGIYTTVYTTATTGSTASAIKTFIRNQYNTDAPTFVVIVGDSNNVPASATGSATSKVTDLYYSSTTDSDLYPEMYCSRMPITSTTELTNLLNKIMTYEQYTMSNSSYLNETLLIAGWDDGGATTTIGGPTIQYANYYYFNSAHGITPHVYITTGSGQTTCYNYINQVGFVNYTAHGDNTMWYDPQFTTSSVSSMTNTNKYFWAMGNCCLAANWGYSGTCFAEALLRAANKGAFGYIGSCPETLWYEDYYFAVGATNTFNQMPTIRQTSTGCYDAMFDDTKFNTLNSVPFIGNLAVAYAHAGSYTSSTTDKYYWEAYHCLGDGSVMPYLKVPAVNNVSHAGVLPIGSTSFTVNADAGSYVGITVNNEIIGAILVPSSGTVDVPITAQNATGTARIVVTRQQRQPYIQDIPVAGVTQHDISVTANPSSGGTVTGAGTYYEDSECTLTATPNTDYAFVSWTKNGSVVSTDATYTFTVSEDASYIANFNYVKEYTVAIKPQSPEYGTVAFDSKNSRGEYVYDFEDGTSQGWTLLQGPNGDSPDNWMHCVDYISDNLIGKGHNESNGFMLSESYIFDTDTPVTPDNYLVSPRMWLSSNITFWATNLSDDYGAEHFGVAVSTGGNTNADDFTTVQEWTLPSERTGATRSLDNRVWYEYSVDLSDYQSYGYIAIRHFDCNYQWLLCVDDITLTVDDGSATATYIHGTSCTVTATPYEGYIFKNWTEDGEEVSTDATYTFEVTANHDLVANFEEPMTTQTTELAVGLNWWTANVGTTLADLEAALGDNGLMITAPSGHTVTYDPQWGWGGNLKSLEVGKMYKIKTSAACEIELTGVAVNPSEVEITLNHGINWIGFMGSTSVALTDALSNLTPTVDDAISGGGNKYATYTEYGWGGNLQMLVPGEGYIYNSKAEGSVTFTYSVSKAYEGEDGGMDSESHWTAPTPSLYANRNLMTYRVNIDGEEQTSDDIEVAAFIGDEVRGRVRLIDGKTYLTVFGNAEDVGLTVTFKAYDHATGTEYDVCGQSMPFSGEEEMLYEGGNPLCFSQNGYNNIEEIFAYQNGSDVVVHGEGLLQIFDMTGRVVAIREIHGMETMCTSSLQAGVYILRMVGEDVKTQRIVVK